MNLSILLPIIDNCMDMIDAYSTYNQKCIIYNSVKEVLLCYYALDHPDTHTLYRLLQLQICIIIYTSTAIGSYVTISTSIATVAELECM